MKVCGGQRPSGIRKPERCLAKIRLLDWVTRHFFAAKSSVRFVCRGSDSSALWVWSLYSRFRGLLGAPQLNLRRSKFLTPPLPAFACRFGSPRRRGIEGPLEGDERVADGSGSPGQAGAAPPGHEGPVMLRCDTNGANCVAIQSATQQPYTPVAADVGSRLRVLAIATSTGPPAGVCIAS